MRVQPLDGSSGGLGRRNRRAVFREVLLNGPISRTGIAERTGLTGATVSRITRMLIASGLISENPAVQKPYRPGRRFIELDFTRNGGAVLGIGFNVFEQWVTLADLRNRTIAETELKLDSFSDTEQILDRVAAEAEDLIRRSGIDRKRLLGGGIAVTGAVDPENGIVRSAPALGWQGVAIGPALASRLGMPFHVESLPNAVNVAETRFGITAGRRNVVLVNASLGIGSSLLLEDRLIRGKNFAAGMIRGLRPRIVEGTGAGDRRTLDMLAGGWAVLERLENGVALGLLDLWEMAPARRLLTIMDEATRGSERANEAFRTAGRFLAQVIEVILALTQPEAFILSGPLTRVASFNDGVRAVLDDQSANRADETPVLFSDMAGQTAARWLAIHEFLAVRDLDLTRLTPGDTA